MVSSFSRTRRLERGGFSLIEVMVVIVIIGLMAGLVAPRLFKRADEAKVKTTLAQIGHFKNTLGLYRLDVGRFPTTEQGLESLRKKPSGVENWNGPYLDEELPTDAWGRPFQYKSPGDEGRDYDLISYGADGRAGGEGIDADITSWKNQ
jgi:general secretion pathway protein G